MEPDLELVRVRGDESFKAWSHGYPYRTVRWHFHPEYELHLITATVGNRYVGDHIGRFSPNDLVFVGPNLPHNWISDLPPGQRIDERCLVLQFTDAFITTCMATFPELRFLAPLLRDVFRGVRFEPALAASIEPLLRALLTATDAHRLSLFMEIIDRVGHASVRTQLASIGFRPDPSVYLSSAMNLVLDHIARNFTAELSEVYLARLTRQSVSTFLRTFRKHTGLNFVQYVNALRIELACQHLSQGDLGVSEICYEVGFNNVSNFNRQFLAVKGMPPSRFRMLRRQGDCVVAA